MANEITTSLNITCVNGSYFRYSKQLNQQFTQSNVGGGGPGIVSVTTTAGTISFSTMTQRGMVFIQNLDSTNYVEFGADSSGTFMPVVRLNAGEWAFFRLTASATFQGRANTDTVKCQIETLEN